MTTNRTSRAFRIAHFGDLHLEGVDEEFEWVLGMVDDAKERGADHVVFTGDIVDSAELDVVVALLRALRGRGLGADEISIVPGNHDIYPLAWKSGFEDETVGEGLWRRCTNAVSALPGVLRHVRGEAGANFRRFSRMVDRLNGRDARLFHNIAVPYGKRLSDDVVLAGLDTTCGSDSAVNEIATGQLPGDDLDAVKDYFDDHADARHRIVLMHHYPFDDFASDWEHVPMHFVAPNARTVRSWLGWAGATTVLCGHIHEERRRRAREGFEVITSDSTYYERVSGRSGRAYTLLTLHASGRVAVDRVRSEDGVRPFAESTNA